MDLKSVDWTAIPWERVREGVERKAFSGEGATVSLNRLQPGHEPRPHSHPHEQIVYILEGVIDFHVEDDVRRLGPGSLMVVPGGARHWGEVVGDVAVLNLDVFTPKREEYAS
jgi:quercetin dioxygenase-like cupin family protein